MKKMSQIKKACNDPVLADSNKKLVKMTVLSRFANVATSMRLDSGLC